MEICRADLFAMVEKICNAFRAGHKLITCGNGGSAADAMHIVGELMKGFLLPRKLQDFKPEFIKRATELFPNDVNYFNANLQCALPAVSLVSETALNTAFANDNAPDLSFAQQVLGIGREGDILLAISTSGNSENVIYAVEVAKIIGLKTIAHISDISVCAPADSSYTIQEYHLPIYHMLCLAVENEFFC